MINYRGPGGTINLVIAAGCLSGAPIMVGSIGGVAVADIDAGQSGAIMTGGIFTLSVKAENDQGSSAVAIGDQLFYNSNDTPNKLSKKSSGSFFGYALETVTGNATASIDVLRVPYPGPGTGDILTAGVITTAMINALAVTAAKLEANIALVAPVITDANIVEKVSTHDYDGAAVDWTLSAAELKTGILTPTNANGAVNAIATPTAGRCYAIYNGTGYALTFKATGQTGVVVANTKTAIVRGNGTDFVRVTADA